MRTQSDRYAAATLNVESPIGDGSIGSVAELETLRQRTFPERHHSVLLGTKGLHGVALVRHAATATGSSTCG